MHWYYHCNSCIKGGKTKGLCRYDFPKPTNQVSKIESDEILLERFIGHEFINGFNDVMMMCFKCNHDIKVLIGGTEMSERIYYCFKYLTKAQNAIDNMASLLVAFDKTLMREEGKILTDVQKGRRRLGSLIIQLSNGKMEIPGPLCALYNLNKSPAYRSHSYRKVNLYEYFTFLFGDKESEQQVDLEISPDFHFMAVRGIDDYIYRPESLEDLPLYVFSARYYRTKLSKSLSNLKFTEDHPLSSTHCLAKFANDKIPVISPNLRIPDYEECIDIKSKEHHAKLTLLTFRPFRCVTDLKQEDSQWDAEFHEWKQTSEIFVQIYEHMQDYFRGRKLASETQKKRYIQIQLFIYHDL